MAEDIIKTALVRFRTLVEETDPKAAGKSLEADKQLARLAIKKYNKLLALRMRLIDHHQTKKKMEVWRDASF